MESRTTKKGRKAAEVAPVVETPETTVTPVVEEQPTAEVTPAPDQNTKVPEKEKVAPVPVRLSSGAWTVHPTVEITCSEPGCGKTRIIAVQDAFQVHRCVECQKKAVNKARNEKTKARKAAKRQAMKLEEAYKLVEAAEAAKKESNQE